MKSDRNKISLRQIPSFFSLYSLQERRKSYLCTVINPIDQKSLNNFFVFCFTVCYVTHYLQWLWTKRMKWIDFLSFNLATILKKKKIYLLPIDLVPKSWVNKTKAVYLCKYPPPQDYEFVEQWAAEEKDPERCWISYPIKMINSAGKDVRNISVKYAFIFKNHINSNHVVHMSVQCTYSWIIICFYFLTKKSPFLKKSIC